MDQLERRLEAEKGIELITIPKSHFQAMNARLQGFKNLIRIYVAKENKFKLLEKKYQQIEAKHFADQEEFLSERLKGLSTQGNTEAMAYHSLPVQNSKTKQEGVSEETYYDLLKQLCHAKSVLSILRKTSDKPLKIESWSQTIETTPPCPPCPPCPPTDHLVTELTESNQDLQRTVEQQQLELESLKEKVAELSSQLKEEKSARRSSVEAEKKSSAKLKREKELREKDQQEIQKLKKKRKAKNTPVEEVLRSTCARECLVSSGNTFHMEVLEVDGCEGTASQSKTCDGCHVTFPTDDDYDYHISICPKLKQNSKN